MGIRSWLTQRIIDYLTRPLPHHETRTPNDMDGLSDLIRNADVLLVQGEQRVSAIIRYLTQSAWSHAALYIGDALVRGGGEQAQRLFDSYGDEARALLIEALPEGVVASPLSKYADHNLRLCRPRRLRREDADQIVRDAVATLGWRYDLQNVLDLARYLIPVRIVPNRLREAALHFGSGKPTEVICSSHIGQLFHRVGFPVLPTVIESPIPEPRRRGVIERVLGHRSRDYTGLFRMRHPTLMTPRDFDLSPFFDIIKFNAPGGDRFDYRKIHWAEESEPVPQSQSKRGEAGSPG